MVEPGNIATADPPSAYSQLSAWVPTGHCPKCGYLVGPGKCPECGRDVPRPAKIHPRIRRRRRLLIVTTVLGIAAYPAYRFGPEIVTHWTPASTLAWLKRADSYGANWATAELGRRLDECWDLRVFKGSNLGTPHANEVGADWAGEYSLECWAAIGGSRLYVSPTVVQWNVSGALQPGPLMKVAFHELNGSTLTLDFPANRSVLLEGHLFFRMDNTLQLVRWGEWRYLVLPEEMLDFCNDVNAGEYLPAWHHVRFPRLPNQFDRYCGRPMEPSLPNLPEQYGKYLLASPVAVEVTSSEPLHLPGGPRATWTASVAAMARATARASRLALDKRSAEGVFCGMRFYADDRHGMAHIVSVDAHSSTGVWCEFSVGHWTDFVQGDQLRTIAPKANLDDEWWSPFGSGRQGSGLPNSTDPWEIGRSRSAPFWEWYVRRLSLTMKVQVD